MDKRESKLRALLLCEDVIAEAFDHDRILDMVDDSTTDDEARRIYVHVKQVKDSLRKRIDRLQARLTMRAVDVCPRCEGAGQYADYIGKRVCSLCDGTGKRR